MCTRIITGLYTHSPSPVITGLDKLLSTASVVADLQEELTAMQPNLIKTQAEVETMIIQIAKDKEGAAETKARLRPML